jgi:murein DD-endopeptidase MepM/ murein hydrolase activator NlpD
VAAGDGTVVTAAYSASAGNYIMLYHGNSLYTVYMHASKLAVSEGATVKQGDVIAYVGSTGISTGAHLHFGVSVNGSYVNPFNYVSQ